MAQDHAPRLDERRSRRDNPLTRSLAGMIGLGFLGVMLLACLVTVPYTLGEYADPAGGTGVRYDRQDRAARHLPPTWWHAEIAPPDEANDTLASFRLRQVAERRAMERLAADRGTTVAALREAGVAPTEEQIEDARPFFLMGTDILGRDLFIRCLAGGGISLTIGIAAALLSVFLGTLYGSVAGYVGGRTDAVLMRIVDILYGLPYILLVVLLAVAVDAWMDNYQASRVAAAAEARAALVEARAAALPPERRDDPEALATIRREAAERYPGELSAGAVQRIEIVTLLVAIGGVSWLTMARVVRGQVLSLKGQPFMEAARALGVPVRRQFTAHLLPNLLGPVIVYATLTVPQAILQESFLSFLGIGVRPPLPSWGNLAADGLVELNPYKSNWWLLVFPCLLLGTTLLALNFVGEGLREAFDPKRARR